MDIQKSTGTWREWARHVLITLEKLEKRIEELEDKVDKLITSLKVLTVRLTLIVSIGTFMLTLISYLLIEWFKKIIV